MMQMPRAVLINIQNIQHHSGDRTASAEGTYH